MRWWFLFILEKCLLLGLSIGIGLPLLVYAKHTQLISEGAAFFGTLFLILASLFSRSLMQFCFHAFRWIWRTALCLLRRSLDSKEHHFRYAAHVEWGLIGLTLLFLVFRALHFADAAWLDGFRALHGQWLGVLSIFFYGHYLMISLLQNSFYFWGLVVVFVVVAPWVICCVKDQIRTTYLCTVVCWVYVFCNSYWLDLSPKMGFIFIETALLFGFMLYQRNRLFPGRCPRFRELSADVRIMVIGALILSSLILGLAVMPHPAQQVILLLWGGWLFFLWKQPTFFCDRDQRLLLAAGIMGLQVLLPILFIAFPTHQGTFVDNRLAYGMCQTDDERLWVTFPECSSLPEALNEREGYRSCQQGFLRAYQLPELTQSEEVFPMSDEFYGRLEQPVCVGSKIFVGMTNTVYGGRFWDEQTLELDTNHLDKPVVNRFNESIGHSLAYDSKHEALFYSQMFSGELLRYDLKTEQTDHHLGKRLLHFSFLLDGEPLAPERNSLFLVEHHLGDSVVEMDLSTYAVKQRYFSYFGSGTGVTVDEEKQRLYVTGLWGLEVFDLKTGQSLQRLRLGLVTKVVVLDTKRDRLYISSIVEGLLHVLDRNSLEVLGSIPVGMGIRNPYLTRDQTQLLAGNQSAFFVWNTEDLP